MQTLSLDTPALIFAIAVAAIFGLVIGSFLNVVIARVPEGRSLNTESRCPRCDAKIRWYQNVPVISWLALRGRCAGCALPISPRYPLIELATGVAFAALAAASFAQPVTAASVIVLVALLYFASISIALAVIDLDTQRLPNAITLPSYAVLLVLFGAAAAVSGDVTSLVRAVIGGAALYAFYFVIRLISPAGMGGGDVKLAGLVGLVTAWFGWGALIVGALAAFVFGGLVGVALIVVRRAGRRTALPFGPWMLIGAWTGIVAGEPLATAYLQLSLGGVN